MKTFVVFTQISGVPNSKAMWKHPVVWKWLQLHSTLNSGQFNIFQVPALGSVTHRGHCCSQTDDPSVPILSSRRIQEEDRRVWGQAFSAWQQFPEHIEELQSEVMESSADVRDDICGAPRSHWEAGCVRTDPISSAAEPEQSCSGFLCVFVYVPLRSAGKNPACCHEQLLDCLCVLSGHESSSTSADTIRTSKSLSQQVSKRLWGATWLQKVFSIEVNLWMFYCEKLNRNFIFKNKTETKDKGRVIFN